MSSLPIAGTILASTHLNFPSITDCKLHNPIYGRTTRIGIQCSSSFSEPSIITGFISLTGGALDFRKATTSLSSERLPSPKRITLARHGLSSWNFESRVQGSSDLSVLTDEGANQAERCKKALANIHFDKCFSSPISRAKSTADIIWQGRKESLIFLDSLKEVHLFFLEGMKNEDAKQRYPKEYTTWREDPVNFNVNGIYPLRELWVTAAEIWRQILSNSGKSFLVVTHKSILRALVCTALGLGPERFRAIDVNNDGICVLLISTKGEKLCFIL